jgi:glycosyltransferase involved in cell wall biosynthesis
MATGVPLVTTRVGQALELVEHGRNGFLVDVEDVEGLTDWAARLHEDAGLVGSVRSAGRLTAERYAVERLNDLWAELLDGFVERPSR